MPKCKNLEKKLIHPNTLIRLIKFQTVKHLIIYFSHFTSSSLGDSLWKHNLGNSSKQGMTSIQKFKTWCIPNSEWAHYYMQWHHSNYWLNILCQSKLATKGNYSHSFLLTHFRGLKSAQKLEKTLAKLEIKMEWANMWKLTLVYKEKENW